MSKHTDDDIDALLHGHVPAGDEDLPILADVVEAVRTGAIPIVRRDAGPTAAVPTVSEVERADGGHGVGHPDHDDEDFLDGEADHGDDRLADDALDLPDDLLDELDGEGDASGESWSPAPVAASAAAPVSASTIAGEPAVAEKTGDVALAPSRFLALPASVAVPRPARPLRRLGISAGLSVAAAAVVGLAVGSAGFLPTPVQDAFDDVVGREAIEEQQGTVPTAPQGGGGATEGVVRSTPTPSAPASAEPAPLPSEPQPSPTASESATEPADDAPASGTSEGGDAGAGQRANPQAPSVAPQQPAESAPQPPAPSPAPVPVPVPSTPVPVPSTPVPVPSTPVPTPEIEPPPADEAIADELTRQLRQWTEPDPLETAPPAGE